MDVSSTKLLDLLGSSSITHHPQDNTVNAQDRRTSDTPWPGVSEPPTKAFGSILLGIDQAELLTKEGAVGVRSDDPLTTVLAHQTLETVDDSGLTKQPFSVAGVASNLSVVLDMTQAKIDETPIAELSSGTELPSGGVAGGQTLLASLPLSARHSITQQAKQRDQSTPEIAAFLVSPASLNQSQGDLALLNAGEK